MAPYQFLFAFAIVLLYVGSSSSSTCRPAQKDALLRIRSHLTGFWNASQDCCTWNKVSCDDSGNVIRLNLDGYTEENTLFPKSSIFELLFLQNLTLGNDDHGDPIVNSSIPNEIGKLTDLRQLIVFGFRGPLPSSIVNLTKLRVLQLISGALTGIIPPAIGNLRQLTSLALLNQDLSGRIPQSIGTLTNLQELIIGSNKLTGRLPISVLNLPNLENLSVDDNKLEGIIPRHIRSDSKLQYFFIQNNKFSGIVPAWLFTRSLQTVMINNNLFSGPIEPFRVPRVSSLEIVDMSNNNIGGPLLPALPALKTLYLSHNQFSGLIPKGYCGMNEVDLSFNNIKAACQQFKKSCKKQTFVVC